MAERGEFITSEVQRTRAVTEAEAIISGPFSPQFKDQIINQLENEWLNLRFSGAKRKEASVKPSKKILEFVRRVFIAEGYPIL